MPDSDFREEENILSDTGQEVLKCQNNQQPLNAREAILRNVNLPISSRTTRRDKGKYFVGHRL
jgi:hypothetical protein